MLTRGGSGADKFGINLKKMDVSALELSTRNASKISRLGAQYTEVQITVLKYPKSRPTYRGPFSWSITLLYVVSRADLPGAIAVSEKVQMRIISPGGTC